MRGQAIIELPFDALGYLLFDGTVDIVGAQPGFDNTGACTIKLLLAGDGLPTVELGEILPKVRGIVTVIEPGERKIRFERLDADGRPLEIEQMPRTPIIPRPSE